MNTIIAKGAEALLVRKGATVVKQRVKKGYRFPALDEKLRRQRTRKEARVLQKASTLIPVPQVISFSEDTTTIVLECINGKKLSEHLDILNQARDICKQMGKNIAMLHDTNIIHGDLTTSNMILANSNQLFFIDFGLSFESSRVEDKAVDLHVLKEAFTAKHYQHADEFWNAVLTGYKISKHAAVVLQQLKNVESRGRYKQAY